MEVGERPVNGKPQGSEPRAFLARSVASVSDQGVVAATGFLVSIYVGRFLGLEALGLYAVTHVAVVVLLAVQNSLALQVMAILQPKQEREERAGYFGFLLRGGTAAAVLIALLAAAVAAVLGWSGAARGGTAAALFAAMLYGGVVGVQQLLRRQLYLLQAPHMALLQSAAFFGLTLGGLTALTALGAASVARVYGVLAVASLAVSAFQAWTRRGEYGRATRERRGRYVAEHWRLGKWMLFTVPFVIGTYEGYYLLLGALLPPEDTGLIRAVDTLVLPFDQAAAGMTLLLLPVVARRIDALPGAEQAAWIGRILAGFLAAGLLYAAVVGALARPLLRLLFGDSFAGAGTTIAVMMSVPVIKSLVFPASIALMALGKTNVQFAGRVAATVVTLTAGTLLIVRFGAVGGAGGIAISFSAFAAAMWIYLLRSWRTGRR